MSPCSSRTHAPSLISMAGNRITTELACGRSLQPQCGPVRAHGEERAIAPATIQPADASWLPLEEVGDQSQAQPLALFRVELGADHRVAADDRRNRTTVVCFGDNIGARSRHEVE